MTTQPSLQKQNKPQQTVGLAYWMARAAEECQRAGSDLASGPVHDLRVALRRCRSLADGLMAVDPEPEWKAMKKAGKALFSSLGELRDTQVMTEWVQKLGPPQDPESQGLLDLLSKDEQNHKLKAAEALRAFDLRQWRKWSLKLPRRAARLKPGSNIFRHLALERWTEAHDLHRRALRNRSQAAFHQLRIGIKRFRYIVENFLPVQHQLWSADLKELQDLLGDVHDLDVLWSTATRINAFSSPESRTRWHAIVHEPREKRIARYREKMTGPYSLWNAWRAELPQGNQVQVAARARLTLWASFLDPDFAHSQRVAALALQVFDGLFALGLAPSSPNQDLRSILQTAAFVHDVGRSKNEKGHHKSSYRLVRRHSPPLGYTASDLQLAAAVARFHRGALPQSRHKAVRELAADQKTIVLRLAGILRFADALDKDSQGRIRRLRIFEKNGAVIVLAQGYAAWTRAAENIAASRHLLETVLRRPFLVKAMPAPGMGRQSRTARRTVR